jgi:hypothetical protein
MIASLCPVTFLLFAFTLFADTNVLVIGSTHSFSEGNGTGLAHERAFDGSAVADSLREILSKDAAAGKAKVVFEEVYRKKTLPTAVGGSGKNFDFTYHCYSLAQFVTWPEGRDDRLKNIRGKAGTKWDVVVLVGDPYLTANMPGVYAEGVNLILGEVRKSSAKAVLLMHWPAADSPVKATHIGEVVYRVGRSAGVLVAASGYAWAVLGQKDKTPDHPSPDGAYLAAASIYSEVFERSAATSKYRYKESLAKLAFDTARENRKKQQYSGEFAFPSPFAMKYVHERHIRYNHTGTSSENGIKGALEAAIKRCGVTVKKTGPGSEKLAFNYGRANSMFEPHKRYKVEPEKFGRAYGFPMQDHKKTAAETMLYGIDKRYQGARFYDGTDLGIALDMIRENEVASDIRCIPIRLMWAKIRAANPSLSPLRDGWHMSRILDEATGTFMYTLLSGRCPVNLEPSNKQGDEWNRWLGRKVGYETAWRMAHLQSRAPGFKVFPTSNTAVISPGKTEKIELQFIFAPREPVKVSISVDPGGATVEPATLIFTPENYSAAQHVTVSAGKAVKPFTVHVASQSKDEVYRNLKDSWEYAPGK